MDLFFGVDDKVVDEVLIILLSAWWDLGLEFGDERRIKERDETFQRLDKDFFEGEQERTGAELLDEEFEERDFGAGFLVHEFDEFFVRKLLLEEEELVL